MWLILCVQWEKNNNERSLICWAAFYKTVISLTSWTSQWNVFCRVNTCFNGMSMNFNRLTTVSWNAALVYIISFERHYTIDISDTHVFFDTWLFVLYVFAQSLPYCSKVAKGDICYGKYNIFGSIWKLTNVTRKTQNN